MEPPHIQGSTYRLATLPCPSYALASRARSGLTHTSGITNYAEERGSHSLSATPGMTINNPGGCPQPWGGVLSQVCIPDRIFLIRTLVKLSVNLRGLVTISLQSRLSQQAPLRAHTAVEPHRPHTAPPARRGAAPATLRGAFALKVSFIKTWGQSCREAVETAGCNQRPGSC